MRFLLLLVALIIPALTAAQEATLRATDVIRIVCEEDPSFGGEFRLSAEGRISLPSVGSVRLGGLTESGAAQRIAELLVSKGLVERATVVVRLLPSASAPISYSGAVVQSGEIVPRPGIRLKDLIEIAKPTGA